MLSRFWKLYIFLLILTLTSVWISAFSLSSSKLKIVACDVGQGDAILINFKSTQILIDGGKPGKVNSCLSRYIPFWDRTIELVVITHPQHDHFGGLINVFEDYDVNSVITSGLDASSQEWRVLENMVGSSDTSVHYARSGQKYGLGLIYLDIVHPSKEFIKENISDDFSLKGQNESGVLGKFTSNKDPNIFSVTTILKYKNFKALMTGDIDPNTSDMVSQEILKQSLAPVNYIKIPHHGSKNGTSAKLLDVTDPNIAVISVGTNNSYGHPHKEIIEMLNDRGIKIMRTDQIRDVVVESDGEKVWINN